MAWELAFLDAIQANLRTPFGDVVMPAVSALGNHGLLWIVLAVVLLLIPKTRRVGAVVTAALLLDWGLCNGILKPWIARTRPYDINTAIQLIAAKPKDYSFPSGHTAAAFAASSALFFSHSRLFGWAVALSSVIAFSRLYLYMHFPTDVLAGVAVGWLCGWLGKQLLDRLEAYRAAHGAK